MLLPHTMNIHVKIRNYFFIWACVLVSLSGCTKDQHDHPNLTTGEELYAHHCAECHGKEGTGKLFDGIAANILTKKSPEAIIAYITTETNHDRAMPVFKTMPADEARVITDHLIHLQTMYDPKTGRKPRQLLIEP